MPKSSLPLLTGLESTIRSAFPFLPKDQLTFWATVYSAVIIITNQKVLPPQRSALAGNNPEATERYTWEEMLVRATIWLAVRGIRCEPHFCRFRMADGRTLPVPKELL